MLGFFIENLFYKFKNIFSDMSFGYFMFNLFFCNRAIMKGIFDETNKPVFNFFIRVWLVVGFVFTQYFVDWFARNQAKIFGHFVSSKINR